MKLKRNAHFDKPYRVWHLKYGLCISIWLLPKNFSLVICDPVPRVVQIVTIHWSSVYFYILGYLLLLFQLYNNSLRSKRYYSLKQSLFLYSWLFIIIISVV